MDAPHIFQKFPEEIEEGNVEYKRHISNNILSNRDKLVKFKTQMLWRLDEGKQLSGIYEAIYYIGIEDDGNLSHLTINELNDSIINFTQIVKLCGGRIFSTQIDQEYVYAKIIIQKLDEHMSTNEITISLLGASNSGKSTFLGVLTYDIKDDGNGLARSNILRHDHEKQNGITTSIKHEIVGHNDDDEGYINYNSSFIYSWEYIIKNSKTLINFIDLPGNPKYLKTTLFGLMAHRPDHALIFINLLDIDNPITKLHTDLCVKLEIPYSIVYTKRDLVKTCPYNNYISNITGEGISEIKSLIKQIKINKSILLTHFNKKISEFIINDIVIVPDIGTVLIGYVEQGRIKVGDKLSIGPCNNTFYTIEIISIHKKQIPCKYLHQNETGTIIIKSNNKLNITKHMMLVTSDQLINFRTNFKILLKDKYDDDKSNNLKEGTRLMSFCRNIYDTVTINKVINNVLLVTYSNIQYIKQNEFIILRNNNELYVGTILE